MSNPDELIPIYEGSNVTEAHFVKNMLVNEGIDAKVTEQDDPLALPISPSHVLIFRRDEDRARAVIDRYDAEQEARADRPDWKCAKCGATVIGAFDECDACGADRPGTEEKE